MTIAETLKELDQEARSTRRLLERVPSDQLDWRPHDKSMSLGQLAMHIASLPGTIAGLARQPGFEARGGDVPRPSAAGTAEILDKLDESLADARDILASMTDADLGLPWRMTRDETELMAMTRGELIRTVMLNHWYHHRGQLTVYLRELDVPLPAIYGSSADERPF